METHNKTPWTVDEIQAFPHIGQMINRWRQRNVALFAHPTDPNMLVSVGETFDHRMRVVAVEAREAFRVALEYFAHGKVYIAE